MELLDIYRAGFEPTLLETAQTVSACLHPDLYALIYNPFLRP
jgi:hypothetical protein